MQLVVLPPGQDDFTIVADGYERVVMAWQVLQIHHGTVVLCPRNHAVAQLHQCLEDGGIIDIALVARSVEIRSIAQQVGDFLITSLGLYGGNGTQRTSECDITQRIGLSLGELRLNALVLSHFLLVFGQLALILSQLALILSNR